MYFALNVRQALICPKTKPNQTSQIKRKHSTHFFNELFFETSYDVV